MIADSVLRTSSGYLKAHIKRACVEYIVKYKVQNYLQFWSEYQATFFFQSSDFIFWSNLYILCIYVKLSDSQNTF